MGCCSSHAVENRGRQAHTSGGGGGLGAASNERMHGGSRGLRLPTPWETDEPQTAAQLGSKRDTFWGSQSSGAAIVWSNLRVAAEALLAGDVELATTVLDAADIRPQGDLSLSYDSTGRSYQLPRWVYSSPTNLLSEADMARLTASRHRDHVGPVTEIPVICRMSASGKMLEQDIKLTVKSSTTVAELKARLHSLLASGEADLAATPGSRPNQWRGIGLPPVRQRIMYR